MTRRALRLARAVASVAALGILLLPLRGSGVLIDSGDGTGNVTAPRDDPGWKRVGTRTPCPPDCGLSYFYLGRGWVITARHAGVADLTFEGSEDAHTAIFESRREISGVEGGVDLLLFQIAEPPDLPLYPIVERPPSGGTEVLMIGRGRSRGERRADPREGWQTSSPARMRWGTNRIAGRGRVQGTRLFWLRFDPPWDVLATRHEAQATAGDSGGPVFVKHEGNWELAGIMVRATDPVYEDGVTGAIDLAYYREAILEIVAH